MAPPAGPAPLNFIIQTASATGHLTTLTSSTEATAAYLEQLVRGFQDAINTRQLSPNAPAWRHVSDRYEMGSKCPLYIEPLMPDPPRPPVGVEENLAELERCCAKYPDYRIEFRDLTTEVDEGKGRATTLGTLEVGGIPSGIVSQGVMVFEWKQSAGSWKNTSTRSFRGPGVLD